MGASRSLLVGRPASRREIDPMRQRYSPLSTNPPTPPTPTYWSSQRGSPIPQPKPACVTSRLLDPKTVEKVEEAVSAHVDRTWRISSWTDLAERASHPAMILRDESCTVFATLAAADEAASQVSSELAGLRLPLSPGYPFLCRSAARSKAAPTGRLRPGSSDLSG